MELGIKTVAADLASGSSATSLVCSRRGFAAFHHTNFHLVCPVLEVILDFSLSQIGSIIESSVYPVFKIFS